MGHGVSWALQETARAVTSRAKPCSWATAAGLCQRDSH